MHPAALWIVSAAAVLSALVVIWRVVRGVARIDAAMPTLLTIADQFRPNGGSSLHDRLVRVEEKVDTLARSVDDLADLRLVIEKRPAARRPPR